MIFTWALFLQRTTFFSFSCKFLIQSLKYIFFLYLHTMSPFCTAMCIGQIDSQVGLFTPPSPHFKVNWLSLLTGRKHIFFFILPSTIFSNLNLLSSWRQHDTNLPFLILQKLFLKQFILIHVHALMYLFIYKTIFLLNLAFSRRISAFLTRPA